MKLVFMIWRADSMFTTTGMLMRPTTTASAASIEKVRIPGASMLVPEPFRIPRNLASMVEKAKTSVSQLSQERFPVKIMLS